MRVCVSVGGEKQKTAGVMVLSLTVKKCLPMGVNVFVSARRPRVHSWGYSVPERWKGDRDGSEHAQRRLGLGSP